MSAGSGPRVHLIGGAGSAVNLTRELARLGFRLTGGIAHEYDADQKLWEALGIESVVVDAFSRIAPQDVEQSGIPGRTGRSDHPVQLPGGSGKPGEPATGRPLPHGWSSPRRRTRPPAVFSPRRAAACSNS